MNSPFDADTEGVILKLLIIKKAIVQAAIMEIEMVDFFMFSILLVKKSVLILGWDAAVFIFNVKVTSSRLLIKSRSAYLDYFDNAFLYLNQTLEEQDLWLALPPAIWQCHLQSAA